MSSLPIETQRTIENMYEDFQSFLEKGEWGQAESLVKAMSEYGSSIVDVMRSELNAAKREEMDEMTPVETIENVGEKAERIRNHLE